MWSVCISELQCRNLQISWTHALRQIVINCYKYHGREDLLPAFTDDEDKTGTVGVISRHRVESPPSHSPPTTAQVHLRVLCRVCPLPYPLSSLAQLFSSALYNSCTSVYIYVYNYLTVKTLISDNLIYSTSWTFHFYYLPLKSFLTLKVVTKITLVKLGSGSQQTKQQRLTPSHLLGFSASNLALEAFRTAGELELRLGRRHLMRLLFKACPVRTCTWLWAFVLYECFSTK